MITLQIDCSDNEIREVVVKWSELLAQQKYQEALDLFLCSSLFLGVEWTAADLEDWISNYGCSRRDYDCGEYHQITSLFEQPQVEEYIQKNIDVDRENLYGLDPDHYQGMVHYHFVPLDGEPSDLTARFNIKLLDNESLTLEFCDIHVM